MPNISWKCLVRCSALLSVALAFALLTGAGEEQAWAEAQSAAAGTLDRAAALVRTRQFEQAAAMLRDLVAADPANRSAKEMLAFALESMGDVEGERQVRAALAAQFPGDPRIQADYGRVLERSGDEGGALRAYRLARELGAETALPGLDAAIERMRDRTALEVGAPLTVISDPDATASSIQAGAAVPVGSRYHVALLGTRHDAKGKTNPDATEAGVLAMSLVRHGAGASWSLGPRLHSVAPEGADRKDVAVGGAFAGRAAFGPLLEADANAEVDTPWEEAAITLLRGGRSTAAGGHVYLHGFSRRLLLQAGARRRELSIHAADPNSTRRPKAWQSLWIGGADLVVWRPGATMRGQMLDEALIAPTTLSSALTLAYRHYDVSSRTTPEFSSLIGLAPRAAVDEASVAATVASRRGDLGLELRGGVARDSERQGRTWRAGGYLIWAPMPVTRFSLGYEEATEVASGLVGQRRSGWVSFHVDL